MASIIFLPGILGSRLSLNGEEVWPPTIGEVVSGYDRIDKLVDAAVVAGAPIDTVCLKPIYAPVLSDLTKIAAGTEGAPRRAFHSFGYDWRLDLREAARNIAARIDALSDADKNEIHFVCHSMGNLVVRLILEDGAYDQLPWFAHIKTLVSLAGPHRGAPTALVRAMGLEGTTGLSPADVQKLTADPRYPALYQLLPQPGTVAAWNTRGNRLAPLDIYDHAIAQSLGLNLQNLQVAVDTHAILSRNRKPDHINYVYLAGTSEDTWIRVDTNAGGPKAKAGKDAGDGTVPLWSAVDPTRPHHVAPGVHAEMFRHEQIRAVMYAALGARLAGVAMVSATGKPLISIHTSEIVYAAGTAVDVMLIPAHASGDVKGDLVIEYTQDPGTQQYIPFKRTALTYSGPQIDQAKVRLDPITREGFYRITFDGTHETDPDHQAVFGVSPTGGAIGVKQ